MAKVSPIDVKIRFETDLPELSLKCNIESLTDRMKKDSAFWHKAVQGESHETLRAHYTLGLCGEAGEVADEIKKMSYDEGRTARRVDLAEELSDVLIYLLLLADHENVDIIDAYLKKRQHNINRWGDPDSIISP